MPDFHFANLKFVELSFVAMQKTRRKNKMINKLCKLSNILLIILGMLILFFISHYFPEELTLTLKTLDTIFNFILLVESYKR